MVIYMKSKDCLISCRDAGLGYENRAIIEHISFDVFKGDYLCVVGENGSGKSTLLKTLLGLVKPLSGTVEFLGGLKSTQIGYLPQQTQIQKTFPASVMEVVLSGFQNRMHGRFIYRSEHKKEALRVLKRLEVGDLARSCYGELSGGQQQRVLLARALCAANQILVLDEPVTGLDVMAAQALYDILDQLNKEGMAIVMVTHDLQKACMHSKKIIHIGSGDYFFGSVEEYMDSEYSSVFTVKAKIEKAGV